MRPGLRASAAVATTGLLASTLVFAGPSFAAGSDPVPTTASLSVLHTPKIGRFCVFGLTLGSPTGQVGGRTVKVQRLVDGRWTRYATKNVRSTRAVKVKVRSIKPVRLRAVFEGGGKYAADRSPVATCRPESIGFGSTSSTVKRIQKKLRALRIRPASTSGVFDANTLQAVYAFQKATGLPRTGVVDARVFTRMSATKKLNRPKWCSATTNACVDISKQVAYMLFDGKRYVIPVSSGGEYYYYNKETGLQELARTPRGRYSVYYKKPGTSNGPLGTYYWMSFFTGGYGIHGSASVPTGPASHGCIRIPRSIEQWVFNRLPVGSSVHVHD